MEQTNPDFRIERGLAISKSEGIFENLDGSFVVPSQSKQGVKYEVRAIGQTWVCSCLDFETRADSIQACKHIHAVKFWVAAKVELEQKPKPKVFAPDSTQCDRCGSIRVISYGRSAGKQAYFCKDCEHKFTPSLLKKARYTPEMVSLTLDLYFSGMSLRKVARTLNDHFDTSLGATSIYRWIQTYVPMISDYVNALAPQLSETWHADEVFVKTRGGSTIKVKGQGEMTIGYLWNVMDRKTRFLLASRLSKYRNETGGIPAFRQAIANAHDSKPEVLFTDGLPTYPTAVRNAFGQDAPKLVARAGIRKPHANNNRIERLNGTLRERIKVQRGWKTMRTPLAEGQRIAYNFVKPHMALGGQTPSQAAGMTPKGWNQLLEDAIRRISEKNINSEQESST